MQLANRYTVIASIIFFCINVNTTLSFMLVPTTYAQPQTVHMNKMYTLSFPSFAYKLPKVKKVSHSFTCINTSTHDIDFQSDGTQYGRGDMHLSAVLNERDIVVYQTGTWEVDGVEVGDGSPASYNYSIVDTIQLVWTHNCEHGFIRGMSVSIDPESGMVKVKSPLEFIDFGPEQLVARLPVAWISENEAQLLVKLPNLLQKG